MNISLQADLSLTDQQLFDFDAKGWIYLEAAFASEAGLKMQDFM
jgi:hypothetical protein